MGFRFQRRVKLFPGVTLNISKSGVTTSLGTRGARVTLGRGQTRTTVGLPGTGLSHTTVRKRRAVAPAREAAPAAGSAMTVGRALAIGVMGLFLSLVFLGLLGVI